MSSGKPGPGKKLEQQICFRSNLSLPKALVGKRLMEVGPDGLSRHLCGEFS